MTGSAANGGVSGSSPDWTSGTEWLTGAGPHADVVLSSRVRLARNLAGFPFMPRASRSDRAEVLELCRQRLTAAGVFGGGDGNGDGLSWIDLHRATRLDRALLVERQLISKQHATGKLSTGTGGADEPRGVAMSLPDERLGVMVNEEDHLRMQVIRSGLDLQGALEEIDGIDDRLEAQLDFAYSARFGYLTACPTNVGTGIRLSVMMHLPALKMTGEIEKVKQAAEDMSLAVRGHHGEGSDAHGDLYQLSNQTTLGKSEHVLLSEMQGEIVPQVIEYERRARAALLERRRTETEDAVMRALGILRHARLLQAEEAMNLLSKVRLGVLTGLIDGIDQQAVNAMWLHIEPAHLQRVVGAELSQRERRAARAELVRTRLSG
ncbi:MAG: protein arginine kinase [Planctomycetota bacterium]